MEYKRGVEKANTTPDPYKIRATRYSVLPVPKEYRVSDFTRVTEQEETGSPAFGVQIKNGEKVILGQ